LSLEVIKDIGKATIKPIKSIYQGNSWWNKSWDWEWGI